VRLEENDVEENHAKYIKIQAEKMAKGFFESKFRKLVIQSPLGSRKTEFPVITLVKVNGKEFTVKGQIDILFEHEGYIHVVDFKTDSNEKPKHHINQMAAYKRAIGDIFGKPVRCWLFYLRSRHEFEITDQLSQITVEESVLQFCRRRRH
jgi:ATP-dependent exoDNAse (exonuclease V) beta subunit